MTVDADPPFAVVGRTGSRVRADAWVLALASQGISSSLFPAGPDWVVAVESANERRASLTVSAYERENASRTEEGAATRDAPQWRGALAGAAAAMMAMTVFHFYMEAQPQRFAWLGAGSSNARALLAGQAYRAVTAITLHADAGHVLANAVVGTIFLTGLFARTGVGFGLALTAASGALANVANATVQGPPHDGIGFSGAVFAAVGALAGIALRSGDRRRAPWGLIVAAALTLAALFGTGETTDVLGHFLGFAAGLATGLVVARSVLAHRHNQTAQWLAGSLVVGVIVASWLLALDA